MKTKSDAGCEPGIIAHEGCDNCQWWLKPRSERGGEYFKGMWGLAIYDVDAAREMVRGREHHQVPTAKLMQFVDYPKQKDSFDIMKLYVDEKHVDHVNLNEPVLFAYGLKIRKGELREGEVAERSVTPIDGSHRIAKAIKLGNEFVLCAFLSEDETDKILTDNRPPVRKVKTKKKV